MKVEEDTTSHAAMDLASMQAFSPQPNGTAPAHDDGPAPMAVGEPDMVRGACQASVSGR